ncbi:UTP6 [Branchiostoma lanceolatum]|uniref:UTP6 protein n=1 Tax=Branchiostoma lanceolatum TaxID=7740 RepID=A0A8K0AEF1_BRALA|nr:UTP6 [Branchiostoma lanceolatum]
MAEFVQQNIEKMLPELEQLERVGVFDKHEIKAIIKKRTDHEYRLVRRTKKKEDFLRYIQYEINTLSLIHHRREKIGYFFKKEEIEYAIVGRIHYLFKRAIRKWPEDLKMWMSHIEFCKKWNKRIQLSKMFASLLSMHTNKPGLWIMAAKWELEENLSADNARSLLQRALRTHPESKQLWLEYFRMELLHTEKVRIRWNIISSEFSRPEGSEDIPDALSQGQAAIIVYKKATEAITDDIEFILSFIPVCQKFDFTNEHQDLIYNDLQDKFAEHELTWSALAQREMQGEQTAIEEAQKRGLNHELAVLNLVDKACKVYDQAVQKVNTVKMWSQYCDFLTEKLQETASESFMDQVSSRLLNILSSAQEEDNVSEHMYGTWVDLLEELGKLEEATDVSASATDKFPQSSDLWAQRLKLLAAGGANQINHVFQKAIAKVKCKDSLSLWTFRIEWAISNKEEHVEELFQKAILSVKKWSTPIQEWYVRWAVVSGGIKKTRTVYKWLTETKFVPLPVFRKYIELESGQLKPKMKLIRNCYEYALREYGDAEPDLWLDLIKLERTHPGGRPENAGQLYWRAVKALSGEHNQYFVGRYALVQTGHLEQ